MKLQKLMLVGLIVAAGLAIPRARAGVEMVEPETAPAPRYSYAPPQPVYYAPQVGVVVYPTIGYYPRPFGFYRYHRFYGRRSYWRGYHWR